MLRNACMDASCFEQNHDCSGPGTCDLHLTAPAFSPAHGEHTGSDGKCDKLLVWLKAIGETRGVWRALHWVERSESKRR